MLYKLYNMVGCMKNYDMSLCANCQGIYKSTICWILHTNSTKLWLYTNVDNMKGLYT